MSICTGNLVGLLALAPLVLSAAEVPGNVGGDVSWEAGWEAARERSAGEERLVFVALLAEGEGRSRALRKLYADRTVAGLASATVCVGGELKTAVERRSFEPFSGLSEEDNRRLVALLREELFAQNEEGVVAVPQHAWLSSAGEVLLSVPYEMTREELVWCFAEAFRRAGIEPPEELPEDARPPRRLLGAALYRPPAGDRHGRGMTPSELEEEIDRRRSDGFGGGAVASWMRILFTDDEEAVKYAEVELGRGVLAWLGRDRIGQSLRYVGVASPPSFWEVLAPFAKDRRAEVRNEAAVALEQLGSARALKVVKSALGKEKEPAVRKNWLRALGACGWDDRGAARTLLKVASGKQEPPLARRNAIVALGHLRQDEAVRELLLARLAGADPAERLAAAGAMALSREREYAEALAAAAERAEDEEEREGYEAARSVLEGADLAAAEELVREAAKDEIDRPRIFFRARGLGAGGGGR